MGVDMKTLVIALALLAVGCATPQNQTGLMVTPAGPGAQVDFLAVRDDMQTDEGFWATTRNRYMESWRQHPWITAGLHAGAFAGAYVAGDLAGWWRSSSGGGSASTSQSSTAGRDSVSIAGDGNTVTITTTDNTAPAAGGF